MRPYCCCCCCCFRLLIVVAIVLSLNSLSGSATQPWTYLVVVLSLFNFRGGSGSLKSGCEGLGKGHFQYSLPMKTSNTVCFIHSETTSLVYVEGLIEKQDWCFHFE